MKSESTNDAGISYYTSNSGDKTELSELVLTYTDSEIDNYFVFKDAFLYHLGCKAMKLEKFDDANYLLVRALSKEKSVAKKINKTIEKYEENGETDLAFKLVYAFRYSLNNSEMFTEDQLVNFIKYIDEDGDHPYYIAPVLSFVDSDSSKLDEYYEKYFYSERDIPRFVPTQSSVKENKFKSEDSDGYYSYDWSKLSESDRETLLKAYISMINLTKNYSVTNQSAMAKVFNAYTIVYSGSYEVANIFVVDDEIAVSIKD